MSELYEIECKSQGVKHKALSRDEYREWFENEREFWGKLSGIDRDIVFGNRSYGRTSIAGDYVQRLNRIIADLSGSSHQMAKAYLADAANLQFILGQGGIGSTIAEIAPTNPVAAQRLALLFTPSLLSALPPEVSSELYALKVALQFNPYSVTTADVISAGQSLSKAKIAEKATNDALSKHRQSIAAAKDELDAYITEKTSQLQHLHDMYENYLLLQGPSRHWKGVSKTASKFALGALLLFILMLVAPALVIAAYWSNVSGYIDHVLELTKGSLSIASLVIFTVPVLAYGWLLKHVSRVYTQNLAVAADAEHRRVMAITFLGLARRKSVGISEQDRALILNALFRSSPMSPQDDGPPSGLLELIKK